jgi:hypothetical protein
MILELWTVNQLSVNLAPHSEHLSNVNTKGGLNSSYSKDRNLHMTKKNSSYQFGANYLECLEITPPRLGTAIEIPNANKLKGWQIS